MRAVLRIAAVLFAFALPAHAQDFPTKPIKLIVPFPPGGPNDIIARVVGAKMSELLGQPVVIDNRGGAGGVIGTDAVAKAEPDGHTVAITSAGALAISKSLQEKLPYDTLKDLKPVTLVAKVPELLVVATDVPASSMKDLLALAKAKPGQLNFASTGPGSMPHLAGELFKSSAGIDIVHVPYKGSAPGVTDLVAGQVQLMFDPLQSVLSNIKGDRIRALAVSSQARSPVTPNVPTIAESGFPGFETTAWWGVFAPAGLNPAIAAALSKASASVAQSRDFQSKLEPLGVVGASLTGPALVEFQKGEIEKWGKAVRGAGLKVK